MYLWEREYFSNFRGWIAYDRITIGAQTISNDCRRPVMLHGKVEVDFNIRILTRVLF